MIEMTAKKTTKKSAQKKSTTKKAAPKVETIVTASAKDAQEIWTDGFEKAKDAWTKALSGAPEASEFHQENINAMIASATAAGDSFEKITKEAIAFQQKSFEDGVAIANQTMGVSSVQDAIEIQTTFAKSAFEAYSAHMKQIGDMWSQGAKASVEPLSGRFGDVFEGLRS